MAKKKIGGNRISIRVPDALYGTIEEAATKRGLTVAAFTRMAAAQIADQVLKDK